MESHWDSWAWLAYILIWVAAVISATDVGLKMAPELGESAKIIVSTKLWGFAPLVLLTVSGLIFLAHSFDLIGHKEQLPKIETGVSLRFDAQGNATELSNKNIWRCRADTVSGIDTNNVPKRIITVTLFFSRNVDNRGVRVQFVGSPPITYAVIDTGPMFGMITFEGNLANHTVDFEIQF